jgi:hypothetical protein
LKYGILDDEGRVVRWVWFVPPYPHIAVKVPRPSKPKLDLSGVQDAPF